VNTFRRYALADWLAHIQRQHWRSIDMRLSRVARVWEKLACARSKLVITVAGTNGKGSCVAMLESALREAGLRVGSYTSPHLIRYNERIRIDGRAQGDAALCQAFGEIEAARGRVPLTYFEFGTLCALWLFARERVEVSLLEAGMGGRLDAVNIIDNDLALLTSIGIDHAKWLGAGRAEIAAEKAGVIKHGALAVCAEPRPPACIARTAAARNCLLLQSGRDYHIAEQDGALHWRSGHAAVPARWRRIGGLRVPLAGARQADNLGGAIAALALLRAKTRLGITHLRAGLAKTELPARCQVLPGAPEIILDVAHNRDSAKTLAGFLARRGRHARTHAVAGMLADKPLADILAVLREAIDCWHFATLGGARGQCAAALQAALAQVAPAATATLHDSPLAAYSAARVAAGARGRVVVFGSFHTVGAILAHLERDHRHNPPT